MFILVYLPSLLALIHIILIIRGRTQNIFKNFGFLVMVANMVGYPILFYFFLCRGANDCCNFEDPAQLSPAHLLSIYTMVVLGDIAFFISIYRVQKLPPLTEVLINCLLLNGILLNFILAYQAQGMALLLSPVFIMIILYLLLALHRNHKLYLTQTIDNSHQTSVILRLLHRILTADVFIKFPVLLILCLPMLACISLALLIFGQKPDSMIQAFTDTYHTALSMHGCLNVECPESGHYLCTVAANGHDQLVRPIRPGIRHGKTIRVNRQLLVANAFEEMIEERAPRLHRLIRKHYDKVGDWINHNQQLVSKRWAADMIYYLMKPLEWLFVLVLYTWDREPENRIARQYMSTEHRLLIKGREQK